MQKRKVRDGSGVSSRLGVPRKSLWLFGTGCLLLEGLSGAGREPCCAAGQELLELERELVRVTFVCVDVR